MIPARRLVLSGGGIKVVSIVGALKVLEEKKRLGSLKEVCGVSAGAWLGFMMAGGLSIGSIEKLVLDLDFGLIRNITPDAFLGFPETFGLDDGSKLVKFLESIMRVVMKVDPAITFAGLEKLRTSKGRKITFRCWATDMNTSRGREFSFLKSPSVKIIDALHASMAIPLYFVPVIDPETGHLLSDGGIQGALPLHYLTDDECQETLGIGFCRSKPVPENGEAPGDLMAFVNSIFSSLVHSRHENVLRKWSHIVLRIPVDEVASWNFEAGRDVRQDLLTKGAKATREWLLTHTSMRQGVVPERRYSV